MRVFQGKEHDFQKSEVNEMNFRKFKILILII